MKVKFSPWLFVMACGVFPFAQGLVAQNNIQVFSEVNLRDSTSSASYTSPDLFSTSTINLTCPTSPTATLTGPLTASGQPATLIGGKLQPGGNLIVDNSLLVTVTPLNGSAGPTTNVCTGGFYQGGAPGVGTPNDENQNCFNISGYGAPATAGFTPYQTAPSALDGDNPDSFIVPSTGQTMAAGGGVPPIPIDSLLITGDQSVTISLADYGAGYFLTSSSIFLTTNCTINGVTGPSTISGNSISGDPTQTFNFDTVDTQLVGFTYDVAKVIDPLNDSIPEGSDQPLSQLAFQTFLAPQTSFATSACIIHDGEKVPNPDTNIGGFVAACKLYTLLCLNPHDGSITGANCPVSTLENEVVKDLFDGPPFSLPNISTPYGTFHEGLGFLMASDSWTGSGGPCNFDSHADPVALLPCPQNLLVSFSGPGAFASQGLTTNPNSTFISVSGVPEYNTSVSVKNEAPPHWNKTSTPIVIFSSVAPNFTHGATVGGNPLPYKNNYVPAPIKGITFGITRENDPLPLPINEPITTDFSSDPDVIVADTTISPAGCPTVLPTAKTEPTFTKSQQIGPLPDGKYVIHYFAQDCAGTQELQFTQDPSGSWSTNFYTHPIAIDTTPPVISGVSLSNTGTIHLNSTLYVNYTCSDAPSGSGVVLCGTKSYAHDSTYTTTLKAQLSTCKKGTFTYTIVAKDGAGNNATPQKVTYTVVQ